MADLVAGGGSFFCNDASEEFLIKFLNFYTDYVFILDENAGLLFANDSALAALGYEFKDIAGKSVYEIHPERFRNDAALFIKEMFEGSRQYCPFPLLTSAGAEIPVETRVMKNFWRSRPALFIISKDISDEREMRTALYESEQRWDFALQGSGDGVWDWNAVTNEVFFSKQWKKMLGFEEHEITASLDEWEKRVHPDDLKDVYRDLNAHLNGETEYYRNEHRVLAKDGSYIWILDRGKVISRTADGKPRRIIGTHTDITYRKLAERELAHKEKMLEAIALATSELLENRDFKSAISRALPILGNAAEVDRVYLFENAYDYEGNGYTSQSFEWNSGAENPQIDNPELQGLPFDAIKEFVEPLKNNEPFTAVISALKDGQLKEILAAQQIRSVFILPIMVDEKFWGFVGFDDCKTEREWRSSEVSILKAFSVSISRAIERGIAETEMARAREKAESANVAKGRFLANMSHEIRTPMNGVLGFLDLLEESELTPVQREFVRQAHTSSELLLYLINDILDFSKIEAGKLSMEIINFDLPGLVKDAAAMLAPKAAAKNVSLRLEIDSGVAHEVAGDPARLKQILNNIISNAVKFTHFGAIEVKVFTEEDSGDSALIRFEVRDTGIGISSDGIANLFKPFSQADDSTTRKYGGTGLGLAISKELARMMNGDIKVESSEGLGSTFILTARFQVIRRGHEFDSRRASLKKSKILIAGCEPDGCAAAAALLKSEGCEIHTADTIARALVTLVGEAGVSRPFNLIIADSLINGATVCELASAVNSIARFRGVKIIVIRSAQEMAGTSKGCETCFCGSLVRPVNSGSLITDIIEAVCAEEASLNHVSAAAGDSSPDIKFPATGAVKKAPARKLDILLAEDNEINRKLIGAMLQSRGYRFEFAANGKEAFEKCAAKKYDIVFMDCQMPVMDGYESARMIRSSVSEDKKPYIVAMTANAMRGDREKCLAAEMDEYISKPIDFKAFFELLQRRACEKYGAGKGPVEIDLDEIYKTFRDETGLEDADARDLFFDYVNSLSLNLKIIEDALNRADFKTVKSLAHQLKGSAGTMKFHHLAERLIEFEEKAISGDIFECRNIYRTIKHMFE